MEDHNAKNEDIELEDSEEELLFDEEYQEADSAKKIAKLKKDLKKCLQEKQEYLDGWQRERASLTNLKRDLAQDKQKAIQFAHEQIINDILPVLDSFHMAFANKEAWEKNDETWRMGIEHIYNQLKSVLAQYGVTEFSDLGSPFDPGRHYPQEMILVEKESDDNIVMEVMQKGYMINNSVLRPARVKVGEYKKISKN